MRFESLFWVGMIAAAALGLLRFESDEAAAQAPSEKAQSQIVERFDARAVELRNLTGVLQIESGDWDQVEIAFEGRPEDLAEIGRWLEADTLVVDGSDLAQGSVTSSTVVGAVSVFVAEGGSSQVIIGGKRLGDPASWSGTPLETRLRLPRGLSLKVLGHQGDVIIGDHKGPLVLDLIAGAAELGQIRDARLSLTGAGSIAAREALGDLSIAVTGDGEVRISQSLLEHLEVGVTGNGAVDVAGTARYASLSLVGSGRIYLAEAERQPLVQRIGSGQVVIGTR